MPQSFRDNDAGYTTWLERNPEGFVLDCHSAPKPDHLVVHRAGCAAISGTPADGGSWTAGEYIKLVARTPRELDIWADGHVRTGLVPARCEVCLPGA